jgi:F-type H+-transporting ATPase subunit alpha
VGSDAQTPGMKQVAGSLKLDLAQYRELAAFAQFGSDLDKATKARIDLGQRQMEILKQPQYSPMSVEHQIMIVYIASKGYLNGVEVDKVAAWEAAFHPYMDANYADLVKTIYETSVVNGKKLPPEVFTQIEDATKEFQKSAPR